MIIPSCTYRVQFNPKFTFKDLTGIIDYLEELGVTCIYGAPILRPVAGSEHGYDGIDASQINPELGTYEDLKELSTQLKKRGINWIQDIVPNHLAFHTTNVWLNDVLERGMNSAYSSFFDIDWNHPSYPNKLMAPVLESPLAECLQQDKIRLSFSNTDGFHFDYYGNHYPLNIEAYPLLLSESMDSEDNQVNAALNAVANNPSTSFEHWRQLKTQLLTALEPAADAITRKVNSFNEDKKLLYSILESQHYVLCHYAESHTRINYRRFFNVNSLICLRMEDEQVFQAYHKFIHRLYEDGIIQGLRIDHVDGLKNPHEYVRWLRALFGDDCYIIVEKILDIKEELPASMAIQGTSGYEFLSYINQVITDRRGSEKLLAIYQQYVPQYHDYDDLVFRNKLANLETYLNGEWDNLLRLLLSLNLVEDGEMRLPDLKMALGVFMAAFPVYRVYIEKLPLEINDEQLVVAAFVKAHKKFPDLQTPLTLLRGLFEPHPDEVINTNRLRFIQRVMQFTGPLAAKGVEDTTFYLYNPLISHNEVGDQPCVLGMPVREFHEKMQQRLVKNAFSLNCTSTHDTKRGEDNRLRINVISELAHEWSQLVEEWQRLNEPFRQQLDSVIAPIINDEYFLYQAIIGGFPENLKVSDVFVSRTKRYFTKVLRESKLMSDHVKPNVAYEEACNKFIEHLLNPSHKFLQSLLPFVKKAMDYANTYTMVQVTIKTTAPGIPDIYQGCELWDLSYVDPDNRRPVDFSLRRRLLAELREKENESNLAALKWAHQNYQVGGEKLLVTSRMLHLRKAKNELFVYGEYLPIFTEGSDRVVIAYARKYKSDWVLVVLPLGIVANEEKELTVCLPNDAPKQWKSIFTGDAISGDAIQIPALFKKFPVAVFVPA